MSRLMVAIVGVLSVLGIGAGLAMQPAVSAESDRANSEPTGPPAGVRFITVDVFIDSGDTPLAAYQIDLKATSDGGRVLLAGIEGGEHTAFATPAFYDARALHADEDFDHVVLAAFSTGDDLPNGRTRVATLHYQVPTAGEINLVIQSLVAGDPVADEINAEAVATIRPRSGSRNDDSPSPEQGDDP